MSMKKSHTNHERQKLNHYKPRKSTISMIFKHIDLVALKFFKISMACNVTTVACNVDDMDS